MSPVSLTHSVVNSSKIFAVEGEGRLYIYPGVDGARLVWVFDVLRGNDLLSLVLDANSGQLINVLVEPGQRESHPVQDGVVPAGLAAGAPTLNVEYLLCFGSNYVSWTQIGGATGYEIMGSNYYNFTYPFLVKLTSGSSTLLNVQSSLWIRVRAKFGTSTGNYSNQEQARYVGCCF